MEKGILIKHKKPEGCGYEWTYKGKMTATVNCPNCRKVVKIKR